MIPPYKTHFKKKPDYFLKILQIPFYRKTCHCEGYQSSEANWFCKHEGV